MERVICWLQLIRHRLLCRPVILLSIFTVGLRTIPCSLPPTQTPQVCEHRLLLPTPAPHSPSLLGRHFRRYILIPRTISNTLAFSGSTVTPLPRSTAHRSRSRLITLRWITLLGTKVTVFIPSSTRGTPRSNCHHLHNLLKELPPLNRKMSG